MTQEERIQELEAENKRLQGIVGQVDDIFIVDWICVKGDDYRQAMFDWLQCNMNINADPCVSGEARDKYKALALLIEDAFVDGAKWWEFEKTGFTMRPSDQNDALDTFKGKEKYQLAHDVLKRMREEEEMDHSWA